MALLGVGLRAALPTCPAGSLEPSGAARVRTVEAQVPCPLSTPSVTPPPPGMGGVR